MSAGNAMHTLFKRILCRLILPVAACQLACMSPAHAATDCSLLLDLDIAEVQIQQAELIAKPAPHCKATGVIGRNIGFSVWLPHAWNGRFVMGGAGGFVRPEDNHALRLLGDSVITRGFATASTDTGHTGGGQESSWALNDLEAIVNYGHLGMHRAVVASKAVINRYYAQRIGKSFFFGCSNGGRQALHEAQRYPGDFDGIVAGAPALNWTGNAGAFVNIVQHMLPDPSNLGTALVTPDDRRLLRDAIETQCDALDGLRDGILHDPNACKFDAATLQCDVHQTSGCLSKQKIAAIQSVYQGPKHSGGPLFFGFPFGAEDVNVNGWGSWLTDGPPEGGVNAAFNFGVGIMRNFVYHDPNWDYTTYDWERFRRDVEPVANVLNADNPDLSAFRAQGGKLLMYHGWADVALTAHMSTDYVDRVYATDSNARADVRLFMMPGVLHCYNGRGPSVVDWLQVLESWHDDGRPPQHLAARYPDREGARKLCAWPAQARYQGGDRDTPDAYTCK